MIKPPFVPFVLFVPGIARPWQAVNNIITKRLLITTMNICRRPDKNLFIVLLLVKFFLGTFSIPLLFTLTILSYLLVRCYVLAYFPDVKWLIKRMRQGEKRNSCGFLFALKMEQMLSYFPS